MNEKFVLILERYPFRPYWHPVSKCWLQESEFKTRINKRHYHEHVKYIGESWERDSLMLYPESIAQKIVACLQLQHDYAEYTFLYDI